MCKYTQNLQHIQIPYTFRKISSVDINRRASCTVNQPVVLALDHKQVIVIHKMLLLSSRPVVSFSSISFDVASTWCLDSICCSMFRYLAFGTIQVTSNDESTKIKICMKQKRKKKSKKPQTMMRMAKMLERKWKRAKKKVAGIKKTFSKWNADCEESTSTRCAIMSTNSANWMKWNTYISFDYLRIVHSWNMVDERWKIIHANQFPFEVFKRGMLVDVLIFNAGVLHVFMVFSLIIIP